MSNMNLALSQRKNMQFLVKHLKPHIFRSSCSAYHTLPLSQSLRTNDMVPCLNKFQHKGLCSKASEAPDLIAEPGAFHRSHPKGETTVFNQASVRVLSIKSYTCLMDQLDTRQFISELGLPDTFNSWVKVSELHLWMLLLFYTNSQHPHMSFLSQRLVQNFWDDAEARAKKLGVQQVDGPHWGRHVWVCAEEHIITACINAMSNNIECPSQKMNSSLRKKSLIQLGHQFRSALLAYDEAILSDDKVLASALWLILLQKKVDDPVVIELLVQYVRKQVHNLMSQINNPHITYRDGFMPLLPLHGDGYTRAMYTSFLQSSSLHDIDVTPEEQAEITQQMNMLR